MQTLFVQVVVQVCLKYIQMEIAMPLVSVTLPQKMSATEVCCFEAGLSWRSVFEGELPIGWECGCFWVDGLESEDLVGLDGNGDYVVLQV